MRNGRFPAQRGRPDDNGVLPPAESSDKPRRSPVPSRPYRPYPPPDRPPSDSPPSDRQPSERPPPEWPPGYQASEPQQQSPYSFPPARSALGLRRVLALFGLVVCGVAAGWFAVVGWVVPAALLSLLALVAVVDLVVIQHRIRHDRR